MSPTLILLTFILGACAGAIAVLCFFFAWWIDTSYLPEDRKNDEPI